MGRLQGKTAVVFGGSRGIGRAVAERLGRDGAAVLVGHAFEHASGADVVKAIESAGGRACTFPADVANAEQVAKLFEDALHKLSHVDILVNAAGRGVFAPTAALTDDDYDQVFSVNARGVMYVLREAARHVSDGGRIVHLSSASVLRPSPGNGVYAASKAAGEQLALNLAQEVAPRGITVNVVSPGPTATGSLAWPPDRLDTDIAQCPLHRTAQAADIADIVAFLVSDDSRWVTGQVIRATGGLW